MSPLSPLRGLTPPSPPETTPMTRPRRRRRQPGFTLVELMVVILILAILIALLLPAIMGAIATARDGAVLAEINNLGQALASFKNQYGDYPPSRIILMENGAFDTTGNPPPNPFLGTPPLISPSDITYAQLCQRSLKYLRKFFPRAVFSSTSTPPSNNTWYDFNGDGVFQNNVPILLTGEECLVFFLGGIPNPGGGTIGMSGFNRNPQNPFLSQLQALYLYNNNQLASPQTNRSAPIFEFKNDRLVDGDGDGIPGYTDLIGSGDQARYYAYFSSYSGGSYDPNDVNFYDPNDYEINGSGVGPIGRVFQVNFAIPNDPYGIGNYIGSPSPNPYTSDSPGPNGPPPHVFLNSESYQIISPGRDRNYGVGGTYISTNTTNPLPDVGDGLGSGGYNTSWNIDDSIRQYERDNLTNFATSRLD
jgi:prepilin-type N-terminal cleavage/methylation domain-containing protein